MNYYQARQRDDDMRWDYTCMNDGRIWPVGYCRPWSDWDETMRKMHPERYAEALATKEKHHGGGHATAEEAEACYREYLLDHRLILMGEQPGLQTRCCVCREWTTFVAQIDMQTWTLCVEHNNRAEVEKLFGSVGAIISSY